MNKRNTLRSAVAFVSWLVGAALIIWLFLVARSSILGLLEATYVRDSVRRAWQLKAFDKFFALIAASLGLGLIAAAEPYFQRIADRPDLARAIAQVLGPELLIIALFHGTSIALQGFMGGTWHRWLILGIELLLGVGGTVYAYFIPTRPGRLAGPASDQNPNKLT